MPERGFVGPQLLELVLGEVAYGESLAFESVTGERLELAHEELDQRGFPCPVRTEQPQPRARTQAQPDVLEHGLARIACRGVFDGEQRIGRARGHRKLEIERRIDVGGRYPLHA